MGEYAKQIHRNRRIEVADDDISYSKDNFFHVQNALSLSLSLLQVWCVRKYYHTVIAIV